MRLEWIRCFNEVAKSGSITKAAEKLFITQPAVTKMIHSLERELDETLLIRSSTGVQLTEQGAVFLKFCQKVLQEYEKYLREKVSCKKSAAYEGVLELAVSPFLLQSYYEIITTKIRYHFPRVKVRLIEADVYAVADLIQEEPKILGLVMVNRDIKRDITKYLVCQELYFCPMVLCAAKDSEWALKKREETIVDVPRENIIVGIGAKQNAFFPEGWFFESYTINMDIIQQRLLQDKTVCAAIPQVLVGRQFVDDDIEIIEPWNNEEAIFSLVYSPKVIEESIYPEGFVSKIEAILKDAVMNR